MKNITRIAIVACFLVAIVPTLAMAASTELARGTLVLDAVHGESLEGNLTGESPDRTVAVYLPPSYSTSTERRFPALYLLHGIGGTHEDWTRGMGSQAEWNTIQDIMDRGIAEGRISEMIVVVPNQLTRGGGSFYTNSAVTGAWEDFTVQELVAFVDGNYRTLARASSRGIAGHSMGGYGAIMLGMKHPGVFNTVYGMNSALLGWGGDVASDNPGFEQALRATPESLNPRLDVYVPSFLCVAQAFSPNPDNAPFLADLPFERRGGRMEPAEPAHEKWTRKMPLYLVEEYRDNLLSLRGLRFDSGSADRFSHIVLGNRALSQKLSKLGIAHAFEEYNGDHLNRLFGTEGRLATEVLPWFSRILERE